MWYSLVAYWLLPFLTWKCSFNLWLVGPFSFLSKCGFFFFRVQVWVIFVCSMPFVASYNEFCLNHQKTKNCLILLLVVQTSVVVLNPRVISAVTCAAVPIVYEVHRLRDGKSFATRRVEAIQKGTVIFTLFASFQVVQLFVCLVVVAVITTALKLQS